MSRPKLPDDKLKHKRRIRKSPLRSTAKSIPRPSKAEIKKWQALANICVAAVLSNDRVDNVGVKAKVEIFFAKKAKKPDGWPIGRVVEETEEGVTISYNAELLLVWLYDRGLTPFTPHDLYRAKSGVLTEIEKQLDSICGISI